MKLSIRFKQLLPMLALLLSTSAFAANKGSFSIITSATINGHQLAPGDYQAKWDGTGPAVQVSILSNGKLVTTVPARLVELSSPGPDNAVGLNQHDDGSWTVREIYFAGKKYELDLSGTAAATEPTGQADNN
jgi:hypothetical protein